MSGPGSSQELPRRYGKYELLERIGTGGMAEIYRARLTGIGGFAKTVVIKRLHPKHADQLEYVQLFVEEAKLAAEVQHKNVVNVFDLGSLETGEVYMAMEYIAGTDLKNVLRHANVSGRRVPPWLSVHVVGELLEALSYAHELTDEHGRARNIVHCDVTPENVFLSRTGEIKLGDFGVAQDDARVSEAFEGQVRGKVPYMSPEQIHGEKPDRRTDIFAVGVVLWECLTQRRLFAAPTQGESVRKVLYAPRIPPSHFVADVPPALDQIVLEALTVSAESRIPDCRTMQLRLLDVLDQIRPRHTLTDVRESFAALFPEEPDAEVLEIEPDAIIDDQPSDSAPAAQSVPSNDSGSLVRAGLAQASGLRAISTEVPVQRPAQSKATGDLPTPERMPPPERLPPPPPPRRPPPRMPPPRRRAPAPREAPSQPAPSSVEPGARALQVWLAMGGDPSQPPPRLPPPRRYLAPIPSPPAGVETSDIVRRLPSRQPLPARPAAQGSLLPGAPVPASPPPRVDSSATRHPLWVRDPGGTVLGPLGPAAALEAIRSLLDGAPAPTISVSTNGRQWLQADQLMPLLGEVPPPSTGAAPPLSATNLDSTSLTALFGHLARSRQSGHVMVERRSAMGATRWCLELQDGQLVQVAKTQEPFEIWSRALATGSGAQSVGAAVFRIVTEHVPFSRIATQQDLEQLRPHRVQVLQSRLQELFSEDDGLVWHVEGRAGESALGPTIGLLRLLPAVVSRARRRLALRAALEPFMNVPLVRSERFDREALDLDLPETERRRLEPFGTGHTLAQSLATSTSVRDEKLGLVLAYILLELGLLTPYYSRAPSRS